MGLFVLSTCYKERALGCDSKNHSQMEGKLDQMEFSRGKLGRMMNTYYIPLCKIRNPHQQEQCSWKIPLPNSNLGSRILTFFPHSPRFNESISHTIHSLP